MKNFFNQTPREPFITKKAWTRQDEIVNFSHKYLNYKEYSSGISQIIHMKDETSKTEQLFGMGS